MIYELTSGNLLTPLPGVEPPSKKLFQITDAAADMPTTLWFTEDNQLDNLIVSAQATICYNLMVHITRLYGDDDKDFPLPGENLCN